MTSLPDGSSTMASDIQKTASNGGPKVFVHGVRATVVLPLALTMAMVGCVFDPSGIAPPTDAMTMPDVLGADVETPGEAGIDADITACGNHVIDPGEACDGTNTGGATCQGYGYDGGMLVCSSDCSTLLFTGCTTCNNGSLELGEACEGSNLAGQTCLSLGWRGGTLLCAADCALDESQCVGCGDGTVDASAGEACDGGNLNGLTCSTAGFSAGLLACDADCQLDTSGCSLCGDGLHELQEQCDGSDLAGETCLSRGHDGGTLGCLGSCFFDDSQCTDCGNLIIEPGEECDGTEIGGSTCAEHGLDGGVVSCDTGCFFDLSTCTECGNGVLEPGEECDDGTNNSNVDVNAICRTDCHFPWCGDGLCSTVEIGCSCPADCTFVVFSDDFEGDWASSGWSVGDNDTGGIGGETDTWGPSTDKSHSTSYSLWCNGVGDTPLSGYEDNMHSWANRAIDLSATTGLCVSLEYWVWVKTHDSLTGLGEDDWFQSRYSTNGGADWTWLGSKLKFDDYASWTRFEFDLTPAAGEAAYVFGLYFHSDGGWSDPDGAFVDDIVITAW